MSFRIAARSLSRISTPARTFSTARLARNEELMKVPVVNPADKYREVSEDIHKYGQYLISALPKFIQEFTYVPCLHYQFRSTDLDIVYGRMS